MAVQSLIFPTKEEAIDWLVAYFREAHLAADRPVSYWVPGGSTPRPFLEGVAGVGLDFSATQFLPTDERVVPLEDGQSNYRLLRDTLGNTGADLGSLYWPEFGAAGSVRRFNEQALPAARMAVLGLGTDVHTASLFPGQAANLTEKGNAFLTRNPHDGTERISLSYPCLRRAEELIFLFFGSAKRTAYRRLLHQEPDYLQYPAQYLIRHFQGKITIVTDEAAAGPVEPKD